MISEFEFLANLKLTYGLSSIGDDCAVLPMDSSTDLVVSTDMLVEDIDFRLDWSWPEEIGHKALAVSLSDIAAMGGEADWAMLSIGIPQDLWDSDLLDRLFAGWHALADRFEVKLVGGDLSRVGDKLVIDSIAGGRVAKGKAILRSTARPGDGIYVTGTLGGSAGGLKLLQKGLKDHGRLIKKQLQPEPELGLAKSLSHSGLVTSMIDISDGISSDLAHICRASKVGAIIETQAIPIDPLLREHFPKEVALELALNGGEDFELLFTTRSPCSIPGTIKIGTITDRVGLVQISDGSSIAELPFGGYQHFE